MDVTDKAQAGFGRFEETAHELEQAAAERISGGARRRQSGADLAATLAQAARSRPAAALLLAAGAGFLLGTAAIRR